MRERKKKRERQTERERERDRQRLRYCTQIQRYTDKTQACDEMDEMDTYIQRQRHTETDTKINLIFIQIEKKMHGRKKKST